MPIFHEDISKEPVWPDVKVISQYLAIYINEN